jgi:hypothetical protein
MVSRECEILPISSVTLGRGVDKVFKTLAKLASSSEYLLAKSENNWPNM